MLTGFLKSKYFGDNNIPKIDIKTDNVEQKDSDDSRCESECYYKLTTADNKQFDNFDNIPISPPNSQNDIEHILEKQEILKEEILEEVQNYISNESNEIENTFDRRFNLEQINATNYNQDKLNDEDDEEDRKDRIYVISIDNIPHYYEKDLPTARKKMWDLANILLRSSNKAENDYINESYIFTNNINSIKLVIPYSFFTLKYHHTLFELRIDYVIKYVEPPKFQLDDI